MRLYLPNPTLTSRLGDATHDLKAHFQEVAGDVTSGRRSDQIGFLKGDIGRAMLAERAVETLKLEREQVQLQASRLSTTQASLDAVVSLSTGIALDVQSAVGQNDSRSIERLSNEARVSLERIFSTLNTRHGERHLFSGDATDTPPLAPVDQLLGDIEALGTASASAQEFETALDSYFTASDGGWQQDIYRGTINAPGPDRVLAIDAAITDLVAGLATLSLGAQLDFAFDGSMPRTTLRAAADRVSQGIDNATDVRARLGSVQADLDNRLIALDREDTLAAQVLNDLTSRDPYEAALELQQLETNLETAYTLTSRLAELSLLRFLR